MHPRMIRTIFLKDVRDAIRDARVLVAILVPLGLGIFYGAILDDQAVRPTATVFFSAAEPTDLDDMLIGVVGDAVRMDLGSEPDVAALRRFVGEEEVDVGIIVPPGFDAAIRRGERPALDVIVAPNVAVGGQYVAGAIEPALERLAGRASVAEVRVAAEPPPPDQVRLLDRLGLRRYSLLTTVVLLVVMIAMLAVPVILAEEAEKRTLDALVMIASYLDVVLAKALVGLAYVAIAVAIQLSLTRLVPVDIGMFVAALAVLSVTLIGFGLVLGGLFKNANQINTWSGFLLMPIVVPVFLVGLPVPPWTDVLLTLFPTSQGARLAVNSLIGETVFPDAWLSFLVILVWGAMAYAMVLRQLARREA